MPLIGGRRKSRSRKVSRKASRRGGLQAPELLVEDKAPKIELPSLAKGGRKSKGKRKSRRKSKGGHKK
jgi:hypothetical protein